MKQITTNMWLLHKLIMRLYYLNAKRGQRISLTLYSQLMPILIPLIAPQSSSSSSSGAGTIGQTAD
jgi:hypothetical protein